MRYHRRTSGRHSRLTILPSPSQHNDSTGTTSEPASHTALTTWEARYTVCSSPSDTVIDIHIANDHVTASAAHGLEGETDPAEPSRLVYAHVQRGYDATIPSINPISLPAFKSCERLHTR
ncbi:hypothetical protein R3P38DRAFT_3262829 [Favolaschia claudopus]|uniref:Uncharacterized protein n=1 Tax=Favolaschia claudopus TaxID=2862362 RepID=A0AAW0CHT3_9AGAR